MRISHPSLIACGIFVGALIVYVFTLAPGLLWGGGDFATFQTRLYTGQIESGIFGHPLWVIVARPFLWLPIRDVAWRANFAAAVFAAAALVFVFLSAQRLTHSLHASLLATVSLLVAHTFWTYAVMPKPYSLNAFLLAACIYFILRWSQELRALDLYVFAMFYALSPLNHLVMWTAAVGFFGFVALMARREKTSPVHRQIVIASAIYLLVTLIYPGLVQSGGHTQSTLEAIISFLRGFVTALTSPTLALLGFALGAALLLYQFPITIIPGFLGLARSWRSDPAVAFLLSGIALGDLAFLLGATDPRTGGDYVWNLHYYLQLYIVFALWIAIGLNAWAPYWARSRQRMLIAGILCGIVPIVAYAIAPVVARPWLANVPGFRQIGARDNLTYVLSPWKQNETGARPFGESILGTLPHGSTLFADYSIWAVVNYLQVVEGARPDVRLLELPGAGAGQQLPFILAHRGAGDNFLGDVNRYYDLSEIETVFTIVPAGPLYRLIPK